MRHTSMMRNHSVATLTALLGITAPLASAQVQCADTVTCAAGQTGPSEQNPMGDTTGSVPVPENVQEYAISVAKFDADLAAMVEGTTVDKIFLKRVNVTLTLQAEDFELSVQNVDKSSSCNFRLIYLIDAVVPANLVQGTGEISTHIDLSVDPPVFLEAYDGIAGGADSLQRSLADYDANDIVNQVCSAFEGDLSAWVGPGSAQWTVQVFGVNTPEGCPQSFQGVSSHVRADVTVDYVYCVQGDIPPPPVFCSEGCTPGYWKNHTERWDGLGTDDYTHTIKHQMSFNAVLGVTEAQSGKADTATLLDAASTGGGGLKALGRHTAAALASSDTTIHYALDLATVIGLYRDAVGADEGGESVSSVHSIFEEANEAGCPLGNNYEGSEVCYFCFGDEQDCPCGADFIGGGCQNSTGMGGLLDSSGSTSYGADDLVLRASNLPPLTPVIWIQAPAATRLPLNDGLLCLSQGSLKIIRVATQQSSAAGVAILGPGIIQMSIDNSIPVAEIFPGSTWYFQAYYRDTDSPCGGNANLTNAAQVTFF